MLKSEIYIKQKWTFCFLALLRKDKEENGENNRSIVYLNTFPSLRAFTAGISNNSDLCRME